MNIQTNVSLLPYNTMRVDASANYFAAIKRPDDFAKLLESDIYQQHKNNLLFLGGGSNILLTQDFDGLVIHNKINTLRLTNITSDTVTLTVGGGYNRHELVTFCASKGRRGLENLALIPGTVGAAPVQNIGAYGVEVADCIKNIKGFNLTTNNIRALNHRECHFGYRDSVFKQELKDKFFITHVSFVLSTIPQPTLTYGALSELASTDKELKPTEVVQKVIDIRNSKLPSINDIGTAGSFFKNPFIDQITHDTLKQQFPELKSRPIDIPHSLTQNGSGDHSPLVYKISAAQLLELSGICKGDTDGLVGTYEKHCLVLVNHGETDGRKVREFAQSLITQVKEKTGIILEPEVNVI